MSDSSLAKDYIAGARRAVDKALDKALPAAKTEPCSLHAAMRHSIFAGGKRLRPALLLAAAEACGAGKAARRGAMTLACAVECLHTFSLVHDDLPCMDDDDLRRGVPTCHVVFGEAVALLAGDALQTLAFELAASHPGTPRYPAADMVRVLAEAGGSRRLIGGQVLDIEAEGQARIPLARLRRIHLGKTAALLEATLRLGAMAADASPRKVATLADFGRHLGLAFQVVDDILDVTQTSEKLGKTAGKDAEAGKATYPSVLGLPKARKEAARLTAKAMAALAPLGRGHSVVLAALARYLLDRQQ